MRIELPDKVRRIIRTLQENGHEAYAVGGCVRDSLLGRIPEDWDITTSADPYETRELFPRTIDTGIKHGTVTIMMGKEGFEVTTYRIDGEYEDGRHPKQVSFTKSLKEDLARRDFTINAMAYNDADGLVDIFGGAEDLERKVIRCVGDPGCRFDEDALRILRAFRFAAQLNFQIDEATLTAAAERAANLKLISAERIHTELNKLLLSAHPELLIEAYRAGLTKVFLPEFDRMMEESTASLKGQRSGIHAAAVIRALDLASASGSASDSCGQQERDTCNPKNRISASCLEKKQRLILAIAALLAPAGEEAAAAVLRRLKYDNDTIAAVRRLTRFYAYSWTLDPAGMRRSMYEIGPEYMERLFLLQRAEDIVSGGIREQELSKAQELWLGVVERGECVSLKMLAVNGGDLMRAGHAQGRTLGDTLDTLLKAVLERPEWNEKEQLLSLAAKTAASARTADEKDRE